MKNKLKDLNFYKDRENQIEAIESLFEAVKKPVRIQVMLCYVMLSYKLIFTKYFWKNSWKIITANQASRPWKSYKYFPIST